MAAKAETSTSGEVSTIERANEIKKDQGFHECEVSASGEADLHEHFKECKKNPGHKDFIPVNKFDMENLPSVFQNNVVLNFIKAMIYLTVRVCVRYTSFDRVKTIPGTDKRYPFCHYPGFIYDRVGSGMVTTMNIYPEERARKEGKICQCEQCKDSPTPMREFCEIKVFTARHVVFDNSEAKHTTCQLFYDSDEEKNKIKELKVWGVGAAPEKIDFDSCTMTCYEHDLKWGKRLEEKILLYRELRLKTSAKYFKSVIEYPLAVIVSHPHGCSKQVTVGKVTDREVLEKSMCDYQYKEDSAQIMTSKVDVTRLKYTTPTCPGSSGANVDVLGAIGNLGFHSHCQRTKVVGINRSGAGMELDKDDPLFQSLTQALEELV